IMRLGAVALVMLPLVLVSASGGAARPGNAGRVPSVPANLKVVSASLSSIGLKWTASHTHVGSSKYRIYVNRGLDSVRGATHYLAKNLRCGTSYTFSVVALDAAKKRSKPASVVASTSPCRSTS